MEIKFLHNDKTKKTQRNSLRNNLTETEKILWSKLKGKQLLGIKFRRQYSIGPYIVDFFSFEKNIAIEIDGDSHFLNKESKNYDQQRTNFLNKNSIRVVRFTNLEIKNNLGGCLEKLYNLLNS